MNPAPTTTTRGPPSRSVVEGAQRVDALDVRGARQPAGLPAGGDDDPVGDDVGPVGERDPRPGRVEAGGGDAQAHLQGELLVVGRVEQADGIGVDTAVEEPLRQRRAVVGPVGLVADEHEPAVEAGAAERLGRADPGDGGAHDRDGVHGSHGLAPGTRGLTGAEDTPRAGVKRLRKVQRRILFRNTAR
jgi:hypothetical protein